MQGSILEVSVVPAGDELDAPALAAATTITLVDASDFDPTGGSVEIDGTVYVYTVIDTTTLVMTLATGLVADVDAGTRVNLSPSVVEKWAMVEVQADDDAVLALVPHSLWDRIDEGVREPEDQESVIIQQQEGDWVVADILATQPVVDGSFTDPSTATSPTDVEEALDALRAEVAAHDAQIADNTTVIENVAETAFDANSLASIANVSVTVSDYEPSDSDATGRRDGSLWLTRTRARINSVLNPSFEVNTTGWGSTQLSILREAAIVAVAGIYSLKLTNSGVSGAHYVDFNNGGGSNRMPAVPGVTYTGSLYAAAVSGSALNCWLGLYFYDAAGVNLSTPQGAAVTLIVDDFQRLSVTAVAPPNTATMILRAIAPTGSESSVWRIDSALVEEDDIVGRYFDGDSYDGAWAGTAHMSQSVLGGGRITRIFELADGAWIQRYLTGDTLVDVDASVITKGVMDGERISDYSIPIDKLSAMPVVTSEALTAGDLVNVWDSAGSFRARKASASAPYPCHGFVLASYASGAVALVYSMGYNPFVTGLSPGIQFLSTTAGKCASAPPTSVGAIAQRVGIAGGATVLNFAYSQPVYLT